VETTKSQSAEISPKITGNSEPKSAPGLSLFEDPLFSTPTTPDDIFLSTSSQSSSSKRLSYPSSKAKDLGASLFDSLKKAVKKEEKEKETKPQTMDIPRQVEKISLKNWLFFRKYLKTCLQMIRRRKPKRKKMIRCFLCKKNVNK
jgi:hypothetical protein